MRHGGAGAGRLHRKEREARAAEQLQLRRGRRRQRPEACPPLAAQQGEQRNDEGGAHGAPRVAQKDVRLVRAGQRGDGVALQAGERPPRVAGQRSPRQQPPAEEGHRRLDNQLHVRRRVSLRLGPQLDEPGRGGGCQPAGRRGGRARRRRLHLDAHVLHARRRQRSERVQHGREGRLARGGRRRLQRQKRHRAIASLVVPVVARHVDEIGDRAARVLRQLDRHGHGSVRRLAERID